MGTHTLSPLCLTGLRLDGVTLLLDAEGEEDEALCPSCGGACRRVHARYVRSPLDLPWRGFAVRLSVTVRRFCCDDPLCPRKTFAEDFGPPLRRRSRFTADVRGYLRDLGQALGARPGARLAERSGAPASHDTLLRLVRSTEVPAAPTPRVLGVDDLALRRGCRYATLLVDMETHEPIDLLEGRDAETLATWLQAHPGVEIIVRDRGGAYADGGRAGAPDAMQIADRFHLVKNVTDAFDELLKQRRWETTTDGIVAPTEPSLGSAEADESSVEKVMPEGAPSSGPVTASPEPPPSARPLSPTKQQEIARRAAREARWKAVHDRRARGDSIRRIADTLHLHRRTVRRLLDSEHPPHNRRDHPRPGGISSPKLTPFAAYLQQRWREGCTNAVQLHRELVERGYDGSRTLLSEAVHSWRPPRLPKPLRQQRNRRGLDPRRLRRLLTRPPERLTDEERPVVQRVLDADATVSAANALVQRFRTVLKDKDAAGLETWLADAQVSGIPSLAGVANGMLADHAAVAAAVTEHWSNGTVEGHVHKVKLLKRQGYGRAAFALLRLRVLAA